MDNLRILGPVVAFLVSTALVLTSSGALPIDPLALHHTFHVLLPTIAFAIFAGRVAADVRQHGWPRFSWGL